MADPGLGVLLHDTKCNAGIAWTIAAFIVLAAAGSFLAGKLVGKGFKIFRSACNRPGTHAPRNA